MHLCSRFLVSKHKPQRLFSSQTHRFVLTAGVLPHIFLDVKCTQQRFSTGVVNVSLCCSDSKHPQADLFLFLVEESVHSKQEKTERLSFGKISIRFFLYIFETSLLYKAAFI